jgi:hypothetical protein
LFFLPCHLGIKLGLHYFEVSRVCFSFPVNQRKTFSKI